MSNAMIYIIAGAIFDTFGDLFMKHWIISSSYLTFFFGMVFYLIGLGFLAYSFTFKNMVVASVLFVIINIILLSLVNRFYYSESLESREILAICLGLVAFVLFEYK